MELSPTKHKSIYREPVKWVSNIHPAQAQPLPCSARKTASTTAEKWVMGRRQGITDGFHMLSADQGTKSDAASPNKRYLAASLKVALKPQPHSFTLVPGTGTRSGSGSRLRGSF